MGTAPEARAALWSRYDAGELGADELDARLRAVDRAGDDPAAIERALTGPVRMPRPGRRRALAVAAAVVAVAGLGAAAVGALGDDGGRRGGTTAGPDIQPIPLPDPGIGIVDPLPVDECPGVDVDLAEETVDGVGVDEPPANPSPLSDPPAVPEGYTMADEVSFEPGSDPDLPMSIAAGEPAPIEIRARALGGPLTVTMRAFIHESPEAAADAARSVAGQAVCAYGGTAFVHPEHSEITGATISGVIPTTAFANWRVGERRFTVSVQAADGDDPEATAEAEALALEIAALELDAARTAP